MAASGGVEGNDTREEEEEEWRGGKEGKKWTLASIHFPVYGIVR